MNRSSNIELFRLLAIFMITIQHFMLCGLIDAGHAMDADYMKVWYASYGFYYVGVNCFALISGYYNIKFKCRKLCALYLTTAFFSLLGYLITSILSPNLSLDIKELALDTFFCFSHRQLWYICCYLALFLMSPMINAGLDHIDKRTYTICLITFTLINEYFGYFWKIEYFNLNGYSLAQLLYMYIIGGYIRRYVSYDMIRSHRWLNLTIFTILAVVYGATSFLNLKIHIPHWDGWKYNNPVLIIESITLFCFFLSLSIQSNFINRMAKSCLAIYVFQCCLSGQWYPKLANLLIYLANGNMSLEFLLTIPCAICFIMITMALNEIKEFVMKPVWLVYDKLKPIASLVK